MHIQFNYSKFNDSIYLGTNFCCSKHFDSKLLKIGITYDISLEYEKLDTPFGVKTFLWLPVKDHFAPSISQIELGISCIENCLKHKHKIYIHCKNGHGRSPTLLIAFLIKQGLSFKKAFQQVKQKRPEIHLTDRQVKLLHTWEKLCLK